MDDEARVPELTEADLIWNRACCRGGGKNPRVGDRALSAMIGAHGLAMNGGVLHCVECLTPSELSEALSAYRFFGLASAADLLSRARKILKTDDDLERQESLLDKQYETLIPNDSALMDLFSKHLRLHPSDFTPV